MRIPKTTGKLDTNNSCCGEKRRTVYGVVIIMVKLRVFENFKEGEEFNIFSGEFSIDHFNDEEKLNFLVLIRKIRVE